MLARRTKRTIIAFIFIAAVIVVSGTIIGRIFAYFEMQRRLDEERAEMRIPEPVLLTVERENRERVRRYSARLEPWSTANVAAEVSGRVVRIHADVGAVVEEGDPLVALDSTLAEIGVLSARSAWEGAVRQQRELIRREKEAERLAANQVISQTELESIRAQKEVQEAETSRLQVEFERAREMLRRHVVRAPFDGVVNRRMVDPGDSAGVNQPVAQVVALDPLRIVFYASEREFRSFSPGTGIHIRLPDGDLHAGNVEARSLAADPASGLHRIEARLPNPGSELPGGIIGTVEATVTLYSETVFVPANAVTFEGLQASVEIMGGNEIERRNIEVGRELDGKYPVFEGLDEGDRVVIR